MSNPYESNQQNSGDNFTGPTIDIEALTPLLPEQWANIELTVDKVKEFVTDPNSRRIATYQRDATDPEGSDENYRNHLMIELSNRVLREDLPAILAASERSVETVISNADARGLGLKVEENQTVTTPAIRRAASFITKSGLLIVEETEIFANQGELKMRIISARTSNL